VAEVQFDALMLGETSVASLQELPLMQRQLPLPWNLARGQDVHRFAHPAEAELGRLLAYYGIKWAYEPTNFVLRWTADGRPAESFTPDFYLPAHRLYIELTTMRQPLVTRKNRKMRRLRELYPSVRIKLLYRRDLERLLHSFRNTALPVATESTGRVIATEADIRARAAEIAAQIKMDAGPNGDAGALELNLVVLVSVEPSARRFRDLLYEELAKIGVPVDRADGTIARYGNHGKRKSVGFLRSPGINFARRSVVLVTDVVSSGLSCGFAVDWMRSRGAKSVEICSLFDCAQARLIELPVRYPGFSTTSHLMAGFGLGLDPDLAELPFVVAMA
jgi:hypoxanthine-guanine phosphoribosyltransferase